MSGVLLRLHLRINRQDLLAADLVEVRIRLAIERPLLHTLIVSNPLDVGEEFFGPVASYRVVANVVNAFDAAVLVYYYVTLFHSVHHVECLVTI